MNKYMLVYEADAEYSRKFAVYGHYNAVDLQEEIRDSVVKQFIEIIVDILLPYRNHPYIEQDTEAIKEEYGLTIEYVDEMYNTPVYTVIGDILDQFIDAPTDMARLYIYLDLFDDKYGVFEDGVRVEEDMERRRWRERVQLEFMNYVVIIHTWIDYYGIKTSDSFWDDCDIQLIDKDKYYTIDNLPKLFQMFWDAHKDDYEDRTQYNHPNKEYNKFVKALEPLMIEWVKDTKYSYEPKGV